MKKIKFNKNKIIWSLVFNLVIFVLLISGLIFGHYKEGYNWTYFIYFTIQSNIVMGIVSLIFSIFLIVNLVKKTNKLPKALEIIKLISTTGVTLTLLTVLFLLIPISKDWRMLLGSGLFFHVIIPILSLLTFILFEHSSNKYFYPESLYGIIHVVAYGIFYICINLKHVLPSGKFEDGYDWYGFFGLLGINWSWVVFICMFGFAYLISWLLWLANKKINIFPMQLIKKNIRRKSKV